MILVHVKAHDLGATETSSIAQKQDRPVSKPAEIVGQGGHHGLDVLGQDRFLL